VADEGVVDGDQDVVGVTGSSASRGRGISTDTRNRAEVSGTAGKGG
jgi:hypothetical protein